MTEQSKAQQYAALYAIPVETIQRMLDNGSIR